MTILKGKCHWRIVCSFTQIMSLLPLVLLLGIIPTVIESRHFSAFQRNHRTRTKASERFGHVLPLRHRGVGIRPVAIRSSQLLKRIRPTQIRRSMTRIRFPVRDGANARAMHVESPRTKTSRLIMAPSRRNTNMRKLRSNVVNNQKFSRQNVIIADTANINSRVGFQNTGGSNRRGTFDRFLDRLTGLINPVRSDTSNRVPIINHQTMVQNGHRPTHGNEQFTNSMHHSGMPSIDFDKPFHDHGAIIPVQPPYNMNPVQPPSNINPVQPHSNTNQIQPHSIMNPAHPSPVPNMGLPIQFGESNMEVGDPHGLLDHFGMAFKNNPLTVNSTRKSSHSSTTNNKSSHSSKTSHNSGTPHLVHHEIPPNPVANLLKPEIAAHPRAADIFGSPLSGHLGNSNPAIFQTNAAKNASSDVLNVIGTLSLPKSISNDIIHSLLFDIGNPAPENKLPSNTNFNSKHNVFDKQKSLDTHGKNNPFQEFQHQRLPLV